MSLRKAINDKCKDCIYDPLSAGTWLKQVELCTSTNCPLYPVRPMPYGSKPKTDRKLRTKNGRFAPKPEIEL